VYEVTERPIDVGRVIAAAGDPGAGAIATFLGTTRRENAGRRVTRLRYEAHTSMAVREMRRLGEDARRRWDLTGVAMVHRIGVVELGEVSVAIAASAPHRAEAFEACRWLIDRLKEVVPIWKQEHYEGGAVWIGAQRGGPPSDDGGG
jgi:molybdopterin synthase catalytic subunit